MNLRLKGIKIPLHPNFPWEWDRIIVSIDYASFKPVTALEKAILQIMMDFSDKLPPIEEIAKRLGVEENLIQEGLSKLASDGNLELESRKDPFDLRNYSFSQEKSFNEYGKLLGSSNTQHIILFYHEERGRHHYQYQISGNGSRDLPKFDNVLLATVEQIWYDLENDPYSLTGQMDLEIKNAELLANNKFIVQNVKVNFLNKTGDGTW